MIASISASLPGGVWSHAGRTPCALNAPHGLVAWVDGDGLFIGDTPTGPEVTSSTQTLEAWAFDGRHTIPATAAAATACDTSAAATAASAHTLRLRAAVNIGSRVKTLDRWGGIAWGPCEGNHVSLVLCGQRARAEQPQTGQTQSQPPPREHVSAVVVQVVLPARPSTAGSQPGEEGSLPDSHWIVTAIEIPRADSGTGAGAGSRAGLGSSSGVGAATPSTHQQRAPAREVIKGAACVPRLVLGGRHLDRPPTSHASPGVGPLCGHDAPRIVATFFDASHAHLCAVPWAAFGAFEGWGGGGGGRREGRREGTGPRTRDVRCLSALGHGRVSRELRLGQWRRARDRGR